jgi:hypothetical protein
VLTATGTAAINGEANLTFDGTVLKLLTNGQLQLFRTDNAAYIHTDARAEGNYAAAYKYTYNGGASPVYGQYKEYWWDGDSYQSIEQSNDRFTFSAPITAATDMRAPIFYDSNNTAFYLDPASTSNIYQLRAGGGNASPAGTTFSNTLASVGGSTRVVNFDGNGNPPSVWWSNGGTAIGAIDGIAGGGLGLWVNNGSSWQQQASVNYGNITVLTDIRSPIFYDSNNTGYYIDAASTSNLSRLITNDILTNQGSHSNTYIQNQLPAANNGAGTGIVTMRIWCSEPNVSWDGAGFGYNVANDGISPPYFGRQNTNFGQAYMRMVSSGDWYFYTANTSGTRFTNMQLTPNGNVYFAGVTEAAGSCRAPIFYDMNDTSYYVDPNGSSQFSAVFANNWFRSQGTTGLYNATYDMHFAAANTTDWILSASGTSSMALALKTGGFSGPTRGFIYVDSSNNIGFLTTGGSWRLRCDNSGNAIATADVIAYSDARVKENVITIDNPLDKILGLRGVYYNRIDIEDKSRKIGFIAQETHPIIPEVVHEQEDGTLGVAYGNITALLVEAMKEQQKQIDELKEIISNLVKK